MGPSLLFPPWGVGGGKGIVSSLYPNLSDIVVEEEGEGGGGFCKLTQKYSPQGICYLLQVNAVYRNLYIALQTLFFDIMQ